MPEADIFCSVLHNTIYRKLSKHSSRRTRLAALAELGLALEDGEERKGAALAIVVRVQHYQAVPGASQAASQLPCEELDPFACRGKGPTPADRLTENRMRS